MIVSRKSLGFAGFAATLLAIAGTASATTITLNYNSVVTGAAPQTGSSPWLTATITDTNGGGVDLYLSTTVSNPEFVTDIFFSLTGNVTPSLGATTGSPVFSFNGCNANSSAPAGTGPWQMCVSFPSAAANRFTSANGTYFAHLYGIGTSNFGANSSGYWTVAHVQGINTQCSGWVGDNGTAPNGSGDGTCGGTSVPEPGTLALLGLGLMGLGAARRRRA